jgi:1-acyl-sn-glycerol-3-phosphate acyltransferase
MTLRAVPRLVWFLFDLGLLFLNYLGTTAFAPKATKRLARAAWLHRSSQRNLRVYNCTVTHEGPVPTAGLLVSNHLSYLDIVVLASITPAVFVAKSEVRSWPLFGWLTTLSGAVFVERARRLDVGPVNREISAALADGALVVVFPEGTSTNGAEVLPFRSSLLEPVTAGSHAIATCYLHYESDDGDPATDICYWGDHTFLPHVINLIGMRAIRAKVRFGTFQRTTDDRKELAGQLREAVLKLQPATGKL